jgi:hypothetical protein
MTEAKHLFFTNGCQGQPSGEPLEFPPAGESMLNGFKLVFGWWADSQTWAGLTPTGLHLDLTVLSCGAGVCTCHRCDHPGRSAQGLYLECSVIFTALFPRIWRSKNQQASDSARTKSSFGKRLPAHPGLSKRTGGLAAKLVAACAR